MRDGIPEPGPQVNAASLSAGREGWIVFDATPLGVAAPALFVQACELMTQPDSCAC
ncbi:hypothetical protein [Variovorax sp. CF079]|uniref:hypothetical protein n=1 Tax=Variovorax sp. CF079 TaxID=1882774 RepID=UPI00147BEB7E|nr:hypothetical protein [Variovorax sp. CF079]